MDCFIINLKSSNFDSRPYHFDVNENRSGLQLQGPLKDNTVEDFSELNDVMFAKGFGRITDLKIGHDGYLYVISSEDNGANKYKISKHQ